MTFNLTYLFLAVLIYLSLLFLIAYATEHGKVSKRVINHPLTYVLSLGVYATSWSYYGSVGFAETQGYAFLTVYLGVTGFYSMNALDFVFWAVASLLLVRLLKTDSPRLWIPLGIVDPNAW